MAVNKESIGERLRYLRCARCLTQQKVAALTANGINYTLIGKIERGEVMPSVLTLVQLAAALRVRVSYFFGEDGADGTVLDLGRDPQKSRLVGKLRNMGADDLELLCEVVRLLEKHARLHAVGHAVYSRRTGAKAADRKPGRRRSQPA